MEGVDFMDSYMSRGRLKIKFMDMATRIFNHTLDMAITNAFVLYRRAKVELNYTAADNVDAEKLVNVRFSFKNRLRTLSFH